MSLPLRNRRIWITRTQPQAELTAARLERLGWTPVVAPLLQTRALGGLEHALAAGDDADALAFTSQAAVSAYAAHRPQRSLPVFVVGEGTGRAAYEAGFDSVNGPEAGQRGDVVGLADRIAAATPRPALVLNPTARKPAADLADLLARRGVSARSVAVYETVETETAPPPDDLRGVMVHSPRAGEILAARIAADLAGRLTVWAISAAAAQALWTKNFARILVAAEPNEDAMFARLDD